MEQTVTVELGERSYPVRIAPGMLSQVGKLVSGLEGAGQAVVISDTTVAALYAPAVLASLEAAGLEARLLTFPAGEENKTLATCGALLDGLFAVTPAVDRRTVIVAAGGGVTGDMAGFVAACALRGLRWAQCPTTLLADVDASVGGKTGVDHAAGKNLIGAFHQPRGVLIDVAALDSLPEESLRDGLAECVKHGVIRDESLLEFLEDRAAEIFARDAAALTELIARNVAIKAAVVSGDEREAGSREHLNFGHTIGHAIEVHVGYEAISHGAAVSLGMVAACGMAASRGLIEPEAAERVGDLLGQLGLPIRREGLDAAEIWRIMLHDKKARGGQVRMVLPVMLGEVATFEDITPATVEAAVEALA